MKVYKYLIFALGICFTYNSYAQVMHQLPPKTNFKDFGFTTQISASKAYTYELEKGKSTLTSIQIYKFDKIGNILEDERHTFAGDSEFITTFKYRYKNGTLDSLIETDINKAANNGKPFIRSITNYSYNDVDRVLIAKLRAVGATSAMTYYYYTNGKVSKKIERMKAPGNSYETKTYFTYENSQLVSAEDVTETGDAQDNARTYYNRGKLIGFYYLGAAEVDLFDADDTKYVFQLGGSDKDLVKAYRGYLANANVNAIQEMSKKYTLVKTFSSVKKEVKDKLGNSIKSLSTASWGQVRTTFSELHYLNGTTTGDTKYDESFVKQMQKK